MSTEKKAPIDVVGLREELSKLTLDKLKEKFIELGIESVYKNGANKAALVEKGIAAYVELQNSILEIPVVEAEVIKTEVEPTEELDKIPEGEYDIDEETLIDYPELVEKGFTVGDVLLVDVEGNYTKVPIETPQDPAVGIITQLSPEEADEIIKEENGGKEYSEDLSIESAKEGIVVEEAAEETTRDSDVSEEYIPEIIDETKYSEEDLEENIQICTANCNQALPSTRIFLLRKIDALESALERKRK